VWCADGGVEIELEDSLATCIERRWAEVDQARQDGRQLTVERALLEAMEDCSFQAACGVHGDHDDVETCEDMMDAARKQIRQLIALKKLAAVKLC
jgi:hypothetical protein